MFPEATANVEQELKASEGYVDLLEEAKVGKPPPSNQEEHLLEQTNHLSEPAGEKCKPQHETLSTDSAPLPLM